MSRVQGAREPVSLALIGFMGAGKSEVGRLLSQRLGMDFVDLDEAVSRAAGMGIEEVFAQRGEDAFRELETAALARELGKGARVIACGGGTVLRRENVELLRRRCRVYLLEISASTAARRLEGAHARPLLAGGELGAVVERLMAEREGLYRRAAHEIVGADEAGPQELAEEIASRWRKYG